MTSIYRILTVLLFPLSFLRSVPTQAQPTPAQKLRVVVLSDIENEPDDAESLVRFLTYSNRWDVEGIIATTSVHQKDRIADHRMREIVTAYGKVRDSN